MKHRIYDTIGYVDNKPGYIWLYADARVATRAPSDEELRQFIMEVLEKYKDRLAVSPDITYSCIFHFYQSNARYIDAFYSNIASLIGDHEKAWNRYLLPLLSRDEFNTKLFARD